MEEGGRFTYPIIIDGEKAGTLNVTRRGLMTEFDGRCRCGEDRVIRLSVFGECEGYLGVMMPDGADMHLCRRLSGDAMKHFPKKISWAGEAGKMSDKEEQTVWRVQPNPWSLFADTESKEALRGVHGAMVASDSTGLLLALPRRYAGEVSGKSELRRIHGEDYVIFRLKTIDKKP